MSLFFNVSDKTLLNVRNDIFKEYAFPALDKNGFIKKPFKSSNFGRNNLKDFTYEFARISKNNSLELLWVHISRGDAWIKIFLNIFNIQSDILKLDMLQGINGLNFHLPPNTLTQMELREDDFKGMPLFNTVHHKIGSYFTKQGFERRVKQLSRLISEDMNNIDYFVQRWHEIHPQPNLVSWDGEPLHYTNTSVH